VAALGHVIENKQEPHAVVVGVNHATRADVDRAAAHVRKVVIDLVCHDGGGFGDHLRQKPPQIVDVPLPVAQPEQALPDGIVALHHEGAKEGGVAVLDLQVLIEDQERLLNGVEDTLRQNVAAP
jgi:hypothetical protein